VSRSPELDALLGAYALDALDAAERAAVDAYLERVPAARAEVDELLEATALLASARVDPERAPPSLWSRIAEQVERGSGLRP